MDARRNFATATVEVPPSPAASGTTLEVSAGDGDLFSHTPFNAVLAPGNELATRGNAEIVRVTARTGDTLTIDRAEEGTPARTVLIGDRIYAGLTAKTLTDIEDALAALNAALDEKVDDTDPRLDDARAPTAHTHPQADVTGLVAALAAKAAAVHGHAIADVTGLQAALDGLTDPSELAAAITAAVAAHAGSDASDAELLAAIATEVANRDSAIAAAVASLTTDINGRQPLDSDLTAIAALATTSFGRALLTLADAAAARSAISAAAASHTHPQAEITNLTADLAAKQPLDSDLTALAALSTTAFGRALLELADAAAVRTAIAAAAAVHTHPQADVTGLEAALAAKQETSEKGNAGGYASLDGSGKVPASQMAVSALEYQGTWNASTNTPTLADGTGTKGELYRVTAAGSQNLGAGAIAFDVGDYAIHNGTTWEKADTTDAVASVAGKTGAVALVKGDVGLGSVDNTADSAKPVSTAQQTALDAKQDAATAATDAELSAHTGDTALDGGPHGLPALGSDGVGWLRQSGALVAVDLATQSELDAVNSALDARLDSVESGGAAPRVVAGGTLGDAYTLDIAGDSWVALTFDPLDENCVVTLDNPPTGPCRVSLLGAQDDAGGHTLSIDDGTGAELVSIPSGPDDPVWVEIASPDGTDFWTAPVGGSDGEDGAPGADGADGADGSDGADLTISAATKGFVNHGSTAGTSRPSTYGSVEWIGSVEPSNAVNGDTWVNTT